MKTILKPLVWIFALVLLVPASLMAADKAGDVAAASGRSEVSRDGQWRPLWKGDPVYVGDQIRTGADGRVQLQMVDKSTITVSANSRLEVTAYLFKQGGERKSLLRLWTGKLRAMVSKYSGSGSDYRFSTPTAVAGVRGTDLVLDIQPEDPDNAPDQSPDENAEGYSTVLAVLEGEVVFTSVFDGVEGEVVVTGGNLSSAGFRQGPQEVRPMSAQERGRYQSASFAPRRGGSQFGTTGAGGSTGGGTGGGEGTGQGGDGEAGEGNDGETGDGEAGEGGAEETGETGGEEGDGETAGDQDSGSDLAGPGGGDEGPGDFGGALSDSLTPPTPPINQEPGTVDGLVPVTVEIRRVD